MPNPVKRYKKLFRLWTAASATSREKLSRSLIESYIRRGLHWTRRRALAAIRQRLARGLSLASARVSKQNSCLLTAGVKLFGSWSEALRAAGIDPSRVRLVRAPWRREEFLDEVRRAHQAGELRYGFRMAPRIRRLQEVAVQLFGSWRSGLAAAKIPPLHAPPVAWTRQEVLARIRRRRSLGKSLRFGAVQLQERTLTIAARRLFGRPWMSLIQSLGYTYPGFRRWTKESVIGEIRRMRRAGYAINSRAVTQRDASLPQVAVKRFGSWDAALVAAGLDPDKIRKVRIWSREIVVAEIRRRSRRGLSLQYRDLPQETREGLAQAAKRYFGKPWTQVVAITLGL